MWIDDRSGTYWRRQSTWWEVRADTGEWRRSVPSGPLRHLDTLEPQSPIAVIPDTSGHNEEVIELPPNTFIELQGDSAYEIAVKHGFVGTEEEWLASLEGDPGQPGPGSPFLITTQDAYDAMPTPRPSGTLYVIPVED